jgi:SRSO17 transposase
MNWETSFDQYLERLCDTIEHNDHHAGLVGYCQGLMLLIAHKSVEPLAAYFEPHRGSGKRRARLPITHIFLPNSVNVDRFR